MRFVPNNDGGPFSKYAALFDERSEFNGLRYSFLKHVCGENLQNLVDHLGDPNHPLSDSLEKILFDFCEEHSDPLQGMQPKSGPPLGFFDKVWPLLFESICDERQHYFLSYSELLLICELQRTNIVIFGTKEGRRSYLGSSLGHGDTAPVLVTLTTHDELRVRSHFQRLCLAQDAKTMREEEVRAHQEALEEEVRVRQEAQRLQAIADKLREEEVRERQESQKLKALAEKLLQDAIHGREEEKRLQDTTDTNTVKDKDSVE